MTYHIPPSHQAMYPGQNPRMDYQKPSDSAHHAGLDNLDKEMLHEAHQQRDQDYPRDEPPPPYPEPQEEGPVPNEHYSWIPPSPLNHVPSNALLAHPIVIPQDSPGIQSSFSRAWCPTLTAFNVTQVDFLHFLDHLNVCKAASPPLQVLNLAGNVLGFTPIPFAFAVSMGTSALSVAGMVAVARVRIKQYLTHVNKEYFMPRGLCARIAKQNSLPQWIGQSPDAPLLAPLPQGSDPSSFPSLRDRRMAALRGYVADDIQFDGLPPQEEGKVEGNFLDKMSAKMVARKQHKAEEKMFERHLKAQEDESKERRKMEKEVAKAERKGRGTAKVEREISKAREEYEDKTREAGGKELKAARKFLFVVVQDLKTAGEQMKQAGAGADT